MASTTHATMPVGASLNLLGFSDSDRPTPIEIERAFKLWIDTKLVQIPILQHARYRDSIEKAKDTLMDQARAGYPYYHFWERRRVLRNSNATSNQIIPIEWGRLVEKLQSSLVTPDGLLLDEKAGALFDLLRENAALLSTETGKNEAEDLIFHYLSQHHYHGLLNALINRSIGGIDFAIESLLRKAIIQFFRSVGSATDFASAMVADLKSSRNFLRTGISDYFEIEPTTNRWSSFDLLLKDLRDTNSTLYRAIFVARLDQVKIVSRDFLARSTLKPNVIMYDWVEAVLFDTLVMVKATQSLSESDQWVRSIWLGTFSNETIKVLGMAPPEVQHRILFFFEVIKQEDLGFAQQLLRVSIKNWLDEASETVRLEVSNPRNSSMGTLGPKEKNLLQTFQFLEKIQNRNSILTENEILNLNMRFVSLLSGSWVYQSSQAGWIVGIQGGTSDQLKRGLLPFSAAVLGEIARNRQTSDAGFLFRTLPLKARLKLIVSWGCDRVITLFSR